jgi:hypothetical protein
MQSHIPAQLLAWILSTYKATDQRHSQPTTIQYQVTRGAVSPRRPYATVAWFLDTRSGVRIYHLKFTVFWDILPCNQVVVDRCFGGAYCLHHQGGEWALREKVAGYIGRTSETSVNIYLTTRQYIPENTKLHSRCRENLKSHIFSICFDLVSTRLYSIKTRIQVILGKYCFFLYSGDLI